MSADYARVDARAVQVTRWRASVNLVTHLEPGTDEVTYLGCEHDHETPDSAERCARRLARQYTGAIR
jgi:hypothetical protein